MEEGRQAGGHKWHNVFGLLTVKKCDGRVSTDFGCTMLVFEKQHAL